MSCASIKPFLRRCECPLAAQIDPIALFSQRQRAHVRAPIDVTLFGGNDAVRRRVLTMPMREIVNRFDAMQVNVRSIYSLESRQAAHEQGDGYPWYPTPMATNMRL